MRALAGSILALAGAVATLRPGPEANFFGWLVIVVGMAVCIFELVKPDRKPPAE